MSENFTIDSMGKLSDEQLMDTFYIQGENTKVKFKIRKHKANVKRDIGQQLRFNTQTGELCELNVMRGLR